VKVLQDYLVPLHRPPREGSVAFIKGQKIVGEARIVLLLPREGRKLMSYDDSLGGLSVPHGTARDGADDLLTVLVLEPEALGSPWLLLTGIECLKEALGAGLVGHDVKCLHELELGVLNELPEAFEHVCRIIDGFRLVSDARRADEDAIEVGEKPLVSESEPCLTLDGRGQGEEGRPHGEKRRDLFSPMTIDAVGQESFALGKDLIRRVGLPELVLGLGFVIGDRCITDVLTWRSAFDSGLLVSLLLFSIHRSPSSHPRMTLRH